MEGVYTDGGMWSGGYVEGVVCGYVGGMYVEEMCVGRGEVCVCVWTCLSLFVFDSAVFVYYKK